MSRKLLAAVLAAVLFPAAALGVWGGTVDSAHPQVGAMYFDFQDTGVPIIDGLICSGSYAGESKDGRYDVFLTAGHCMPPPDVDVSDLYVSFDSNATATSVNQPVSNPIQVQAFALMPGFGHDGGDFRDLGLLFLPKDSVPSSIAPVQLAPAGYLDALKAAGTLKFRIVDIVGYGVIPDWDSPGPTGFGFDGKRRVGTTIITGLSAAQVFYKQNNGIGTGSGLCFGDSGSPQLDAGTLRVVSVTSGGNGQCNANNTNYRVDSPQARAFLGQYLNLP